MAVTVTRPKTYQVHQREADDRGDIVIAGTYSVGVESGQAQARWRGGPWTTIDISPGGGNFSGSLKNQLAGQGTLEVRMSGTPGTIASVGMVGVGDIFVIAGQSNASGRAKTAQFYDPDGSPIRAGNYRTDHFWTALADPFDKDYDGMDLVAAESPTSIPNTVTLGSWIPRVTTHFIGTVDGVPVGYLPCPKGGSSISQWKRVIDSSWLYGSMYKRINDGAYGKVKAVLWFQGESDSGTPMDTYAAALSQFATDVFNDFGVPTISALLGPYPAAGITARLNPRGGALKAIRSNPHLLMGPSFYDVDYDENLHYVTNTNITMVGDRFWGAVWEHFYGGDGTGIGPDTFVANYDAVENIINLDFTEDISTLTVTDDTFIVLDSTGATVTTKDPCRSGNRTIRIPLLDTPSGPTAQMSVTYGLENRPKGSVYGKGSKPSVPAYQFPVNGIPAAVTN